MMTMASDAPDACAFPNEGLSVWHSIGPAADQEVPHLHFHVHSRRLHDGLLRVYPSAPVHPDRATLDQWGSRLRTALAVVAGVVLALLSAAPATAQPSRRVEAAAQVLAASMPGFEGSDVGVGGRLGWRTGAVLSLEGELNVFPGKYPDTPAAFSRRRVEGLFGLTAGRRFGALRLFGKFRAGFLDVQEAPAPVVCILIFPPPLSCTLAAGRTMAAFDLGGGVDVDVTPRTFIRIEAGDRVLKYPASDEHAVRFAAAAGVRF